MGTNDDLRKYYYKLTKFHKESDRLWEVERRLDVLEEEIRKVREMYGRDEYVHDNKEEYQTYVINRINKSIESLQDI